MLHLKINFVLVFTFHSKEYTKNKSQDQGCLNA